MQSLNDLGVFTPKILLPNKTVDQTKWPVIACDQYTSQHNYWDKLKEFVGNNYSTLNLIFPEIYLEQPDQPNFKERVNKIQQTMNKYLSENIFNETNAFILVERTLPSGAKRVGLMIAIDLEKYDYSPTSRSLVRPTEGTIVSRLPVRVEIRRNAPLELPHILLLIDDEKKSVIESLYVAASTNKFEVLYDTDLPLKSGHLKGYLVPKDFEDRITLNLNNLMKQNSTSSSPLLFAVGDGNHSLATAKAYWNEIKDHSPKDHPARFALVELINLHDPSLEVEPIHRVIFNIDKKVFFDELDLFFKQKGSKMTLSSSSATSKNNGTLFRFIYGHDEIQAKVEPSLPGLDASIMQEFIDLFLKKSPKSTIDYIHGVDAVKELAANTSNMGVILPEVIKNQLLPYIEKNGPLPRKFFSLGEADEKRFYYESRLIK